MKVIEKTRLKRGELVIVERARRRMKRRMNKMKRVLRSTRLERPEKTPDGREESWLLLKE